MVGERGIDVVGVDLGTGISAVMVVGHSGPIAWTVAVVVGVNPPTGVSLPLLRMMKWMRYPDGLGASAFRGCRS